MAAAPNIRVGLGGPPGDRREAGETVLDHVPSRADRIQGVQMWPIPAEYAFPTLLGRIRRIV